MLEQALLKAFATNPALGAARSTLRAAEHGVDQARAQALPQAAITGSAGVGWSKSGQAGLDSSSNSLAGTVDHWVRTNPRTLGLSVTQPLYKGGQIDAGIQQADHSAGAQQAGLAEQEQALALQAATAFLDVAMDQALVELQIEFEKFQRRDLQALQDRYRAGEVTQTDVRLQEAQLANASAARIATQGLLEIDRATYLKLIGEAPPPQLTLPRLDYVLPATLNQLIDLALRDSPRIQAAKLAEAAARSGVEVAEGALLPSLNLTTNVSRSLDRSLPNDFSNGASLIANLVIPIDNGTNRARTRAARETAAAARSTVEQTSNTVQELATQSWRRLHAARANITYYEAAVRSNELASKGIRQQIAIGASTIIDLISTEQALLNARVSLLRAHHDEALGVLSTLAALGRLDPRLFGQGAAVPAPAGPTGGRPRAP
ncbi:outer membrane protein [Azospirillaceae bacterium]